MEMGSLYCRRRLSCRYNIVTLFLTKLNKYKVYLNFEPIAMYKNLICLLVCVLCTMYSYGQIIDRAPNGQSGYRAVTGGSEQVGIDTKTPLPELIKRLELPWEF